MMLRRLLIIPVRFGGPLVVFAASGLIGGLLLANVSYRELDRGTSADQTSDFQRTPMEMVRLGGGIIGRVGIRLANGECTIIRQPVQFRSYRDLVDCLDLDPSTPEDDLELVEEPPNSRWYVSPDNLSEYTTFNCATYAIGDSIGLSKSDWLEASPVAWTDDQCPAQMVLDNYFDLVSKHSLADIDWLALESSTSLLDGDVVTYSDCEIEEKHVHFGRVEKHLGRNLLVSKMGQGPIARGSLAAVSRHFANEFSEVRIYRRRNSPGL